MKVSFFKNILISGIILVAFISCGNQQSASSPADTTQTASADSIHAIPSIKTDSVIYMLNGKESRGYIAYDENKKGNFPSLY